MLYWVYLLPAMAKPGTINLLPQEEFEASILGRILRWATGSFRIIVILTEMIVMGAFLSRFWLDAQNSDLNDNIKVASAQISAEKDIEDTFRRVQKKLDVFKVITSPTAFSVKVDSISSKVPADVTLSSVSIDPTGSEIKGSSTSEVGIAQFVSNLQTDTSFKTVELGNVGSSQSNQGQTDFSIKLTF